MKRVLTIGRYEVCIVQNIEIKALSEESINKKYHGVVKEMKRRIETILKPTSGFSTVLEKRN